MSLPCSFESPEEYFRATTAFLKDFSWIYRSSNTKFLSEHVLESFPPDWIGYFSSISNEDLKKFPQGYNMDEVPSSLKKFQESVNYLKPKHRIFETNDIGKDLYFKRMSPKKLHEISRLSKVIGNICSNDIDVLLDFGSGLGYLSEILHRQHKFNILGLECEEERVNAAIERQNACYPSSKDSIYYKQEKITNDSYKEITKLLAVFYKKIDNPHLAIIGLHACADLSVTSMNLFVCMENVKKLIIMPCCYHKLKISTNCEKNYNFENFPLSATLKKCLNEIPGSLEVLNRPFLRLACQETVARWTDMTEKEHAKRGKEMFLRAIIECLCQENEHILKVKRKPELSVASNKSDCPFEDIKHKYQIRSNSEVVIDWTESHKAKFHNILSEHENGAKIAEGLVCLQTTLQEVCENVVLLDKILYMREQGQQKGISVNTYVFKTMDDKISPRCFALIAEKL